MFKGKNQRKGRSERYRYENSHHSSEDESNDNASIVSNVSDITEGEEREDNQAHVEEKMCELLDGLLQKSSAGRTNCYNMLAKAFSMKFMPGFIRERYFTICDSVEKSLKKGGGDEKAAAAELATVLCVQLGNDEAVEEIARLLKPILLTMVSDNSVAPAVRAKCCTALGNIVFLSGGDIGEVLTLMRQLESIFSASYLKGDGSVATISADSAVLHTSAVTTWNLLFTLITPGNIGTMINNSKSLPPLEKIAELLESPHLDVRMAAGETLALIYELGREESEDFEEEFALDVMESLKQLATDSHKYRAKKDRKQQRATFRDILQFIESDVVPEMQVKFGKEVLSLDTWTKRKQYEMLCNVLGHGINIQLTENDLLRDIFEIVGPPPPSDIPLFQNQIDRSKKRSLNAANYKARTISRAKNRDKRSDF